jgi:hypothetical protein
MRKEINYTVNRTIDSIQVSDNIFIYKDEIVINNEKILKKQEGFATKEDLENVDTNEPISNNLIEWNLYKFGFMELWRSNLRHENFKILNKYIINNPYSYVKINGIENLELLRYIYRSEHFYNIHNEKQPQAMFFDYTTANVSNEIYDLERSYEILRNRKDIKLFGGIKKIHYCNITEEKDMYLEFIWMPTNEDFIKVDNMKSLFNEEIVLNEILKLPKKGEN